MNLFLIILSLFSQSILINLEKAANYLKKMPKAKRLDIVQDMLQMLYMKQALYLKGQIALIYIGMIIF